MMNAAAYLAEKLISRERARMLIRWLRYTGQLDELGAALPSDPDRALRELHKEALYIQQHAREFPPGPRWLLHVTPEQEAAWEPETETERAFCGDYKERDIARKKRHATLAVRKERAEKTRAERAARKADTGKKRAEAEAKKLRHPARRGRKVAAGRASQRKAYQEKRATVWAQFTPWLDAHFRRPGNAGHSITEARRHCAAVFGVSVKTVSRRTRGYRKPAQN